MGCSLGAFGLDKTRGPWPDGGVPAVLFCEKGLFPISGGLIAIRINWISKLVDASIDYSIPFATSTFTAACSLIVNVFNGGN